MSAKVMGNPVVKGVSILVIISVLLFISNDDKEPQNSNVTQQTAAKAGQSEVDNYTPSEELLAVNGYLGNVENQTEQLSKEVKAVKDNMLSKQDITGIISQQLQGLSTTSQLDVTDIEKLSKQIKQAVINELSVGQVAPNKVGDVDNEPLWGSEFEIGGGVDDKSNNKVASKGRWVSALGHQTSQDSQDGIASAVSSFNPFGSTQVAVTKQPSSEKISAQPTKRNSENKPKKIPYGTLHRDSMVLNVTNLNSLFGRIPRKQSTYEPYEFTLMLSGETLMANGFSFPEIRNATVSGYAVGDRSMTCVRGFITNFTFIFSDGRIAQQSSSDKKPLAEIGDAWGNPCVRGELVDDIEKHVAAQGIIGGLSKYGEVLNQQQQSTVSNGNQSSTILSGDASKQALGAIGSGGLDTTAAILAERYESYYEGVYVPQGQKLSLRLKENIEIDYDLEGRKVNYANSHSTSNLASTFD